MRKYFFLIAMFCSVLISCKPDDPEVDNPNNGGGTNVSVPTVTTSQVSEIKEYSAIGGGEVTDNGGAEVTARGICWSEEQNPTLENYFTNDGEGDGTFSSEMTDLLSNTTYYVRAYATNSVGTVYGEEVSFTTLEEPAYVDLGLPSGVKWAKYNVGAKTPEGYGEHYAWGEIETKEIYKYDCITYGKELGDISGNAEYDVATAKWGEGWRSPRLADMYELVTECTWTWKSVNGVNGWMVKSKTNGNSIFLPTAGWMNTFAAEAAGTEGVLDQGSWGYYWTTTPYDENLNLVNKGACFLMFSSGGYQTEVGLRFQGFSIRPVMD